MLDQLFGGMLGARLDELSQRENPPFIRAAAGRALFPTSRTKDEAVLHRADMQAAARTEGRAAGRTASSISDYIELSKPRITLLVVITAAVGYFMASGGRLWPLGLAHVMLGTGLVSAGASVLNQVLERDADARMHRTRNRAIPAGRVTPAAGLAYGVILGLGGVLYIAVFLNALTALLAAVTLASYVFIYTPMKRVTTLNTLIGGAERASPVGVGPPPPETSHARHGFSSSSSSCGRYRTSWPSPGCCARTTRAAGFACFRWKTPRGAARVATSRWAPWRWCR
jgi:hypothetical protein